MAIYEKHFSAHGFSHWSWPLKIGIYDPADPSLQRWQIYPGYSHLCHLQVWPNVPRPVNLVIFPDGMEALCALIKEGKVMFSDAATAVIVLEHQAFPPGNRFDNEPGYLEKLQEITWALGATGVFNVESWSLSVDWLTGLMVELSHNHSLPHALERMGVQGYFYFDEKLKQETRLSHVLAGIIECLRTFLKDHSFEVHNRLIPKEGQMTAIELADHLESQMPHFQYDSERGEASDATILTDVVYPHGHPAIFNINNKDFQWLQSGPPEESSYESADMEESPPPEEYPSSSPGEEGPSDESDELQSLPDETSSESSASESYKTQENHSSDSDERTHADYIDSLSGDVDEEEEKKVRKYSDKDGSSFSGNTRSWQQRSGIPSKPKPPSSTRSHQKEKSPTETAIVDRYLQAQLRDREDEDRVVNTFLLPHHAYQLQVRIGMKDAEWMDGGITVPSEDIFRPGQLEAEKIEVVFENNISGESTKKNILLRPTGNSGSVRFSFSTDDSDTPLEGILYVYHKGRMFQEATIRAEVASPGTKNVPTVEFNITQCLRRTLGENGQRAEFGTSMNFDPTGRQGHQVHGICQGETFTIRSLKGLEAMSDLLQATIESAAVNTDIYSEDLDDEDNVDLLRKLAFHGSDLYGNWLQANCEIKGPIQLLNAQHEYLPLEFVYTLPCPDVAAPLCDNAKKALLEGKCQECFDHKEKPGPCICPFGFLGFKEVIERSGGIIPPESEPDRVAGGIPMLEKSLFAATKQAGANSPNLLSDLDKAVAAFARENHKATNWDEWKDFIEKQPSTLILIVHTQKDPDMQADQVEIGDKQLAFKTHLFKELIRHPKSTYPPVAIVMGCRTSDKEQFGFDIGSHFLNNGAAIVFTSFTKIRGRQAGPIVMRLMEFIKSHEGEEMRFGQIVLQLRQHLLAHGIMVGMALVAYGDADWKIKL